MEDLRLEFFPRRCFFRAMPLLPGRKLGFPKKKREQKGKGEVFILTK
jgi:hypothetical protein